MNNVQLRTTSLTYCPISSSLLDLRSSFRTHSFSAKERDAETGLSYFGSRYYSSDLSVWLSVDPMSGKYPSTSPYAYCRNNPIVLVDPNGNKDKPFDAKKDKGISIQPRTETFITKTIGFGKVLSYSRKSQQNAYNCHSYAWHNSKGDPEAENPNTGKIEKQSRAYFRIPTTND